MAAESTPTALLRHLLRVRRAPMLSTGAYGDEGALEFRLLETYTERLQPDVREAWLKQDLGALSLEDKIAIVAPLEQAVAQWTPLRFLLTDEELERIMDLVTRRVDASDLEEGELLLLHERVRQAVTERTILELVRGGKHWRMLQALDLLCPLGAFVVETCSQT